MAFFIMLTISWTDVAYTVGNLQISISFDSDSQGLAGGIFNVATRLGTSISLALSSSVANAVSASYHHKHPELAANSVDVLMAGFRAGGWVSFALAAASFAVCVFGLRGVGVIGAKVHLDAASPKTPPEDVVKEGQVVKLEEGTIKTMNGQGLETAAVERLRASIGGAQVVLLPDIRISTDVDRPRRTSVIISPVRRQSLQVSSAL